MAITTHRRKVVRRRGTLDRAYDVVLQDVDPELRPLIVRYADYMKALQEIRGELTLAKIGSGVAWHEIDRLAHQLQS